MGDSGTKIWTTVRASALTCSDRTLQTPIPISPPLPRRRPPHSASPPTPTNNTAPWLAKQHWNLATRRCFFFVFFGGCGNGLGPTRPNRAQAVNGGRDWKSTSFSFVAAVGSANTTLMIVSDGKAAWWYSWLRLDFDPFSRISHAFLSSVPSHTRAV